MTEPALKELRASNFTRPFYTDVADAMAHIECEEKGYASVSGYLRMVRATAGPNGARCIFIGNGGSAAIASHMAADFQKNGGMAALCFNDPASLTCISNDIGYDSVFRLPMEHHGRLGDVLFAISSSGNSSSITKAVDLACAQKMNVVTLTGFGAANKLRAKGGVNFYVPSMNYGVVETVHLAILHSILHETIYGA